MQSRYTVVSPCKALLTRFISSSCQTYEGGIGGEPGSEAHAGYGLLPTSFMLNPLSKLTFASRFLDDVVIHGLL